MKRFCVFVILISLFVLCYYNNSRSVYSVLDDCGIAYIYKDGVFEIENYEGLLYKLQCQVVDKKYVSDRLVIEGYSGLIQDYVVINGNKVNVQISISDDVVLLGCPLIKSSF